MSNDQPSFDETRNPAGQCLDYRPGCISIVIPCFNEQGNIANLLNELARISGREGREFEWIFVNDGSRDATSALLREAASRDPRIVAIDLMRNFGQTHAYQVGFEHARGEFIITYSADLETPADCILDVLARLDEGWDLVNTSRKRVNEHARDWKSRYANRALNQLSGLKITDRGSGLKGFSRALCNAMRLYGEWHRFIPDYASMFTDRIVEIDVPFTDRIAGASSYGGRIRSVAVFLDLVTVAFTLSSHRKPYSLLPGRLFGFTGLFLASVGLIITISLTASKVLLGTALAERPLFLMGTLLTVLGIIMVMMGVLGELMMQVLTRMHRPGISCIRNVASLSMTDNNKPALEKAGAAPSAVQTRVDISGEVR